tara:strand:- start:108 stop:512 length:405 start_codon:yes stop_codon:yes gene_type:complete
MYATVVFFVLLVQLAFLSVWAKKEERGDEWAWIKAKGPAVVDLVENKTHLFRSLTGTLVVLEVFAVFLALILSRCVNADTFETNYMSKYETTDIEEEQDLINRSRRKENYERKRKAYSARLQRLRAMREKFDDV